MRLFRRRNRMVYFKEGNRPIKLFTAGSIELAFWLNPDTNGDLIPKYTIVHCGKDNARTKIFDATDLDDIVKTIGQAKAWRAKGARLKIKF